MTMLNYHHHGGRKSKRKLKSRDNPGMRLTALFLCLSMLAGLLPMMVQAADAGEKLSVYEQSTPSDADRVEEPDEGEVDFSYKPSTPSGAHHVEEPDEEERERETDFPYKLSTPSHARRVEAADGGDKFSDIAKFDSITLHYAGDDGGPEEEAIEDGALIEKGRQLVLHYTYAIPENTCNEIRAGIQYYLEVSPHLAVTHLEGGAPLKMENEDGSSQRFGTIYADGSRAWVTFLPKEGNGDTVPPDGDAGDTVLSDIGGLENAYFYLNCSRADQVPETEQPIEGQNNLYVMKFEDKGQLLFGYAEDQPIMAKAQIKKSGELSDKTITWKIDYTPWQNPSPGDPVTQDTPFELQDTITPQHSYVENSAKINGAVVPVYVSRDQIPGDAESYLLVERSDDTGSTTLTFGGTKLNAGEATKGNPAAPLSITYETVVRDSLLLPGEGGAQKVTNDAELFAGDGDGFQRLNISCSTAVPIPLPTWLTKTGKTTRHTDGTGSTTDWTVTFQPNGFSFVQDNSLTLHDRLPEGSTLVDGLVKVDGVEASAVSGENKEFMVSEIVTDKQPVIITYQTHVPEEMYDSGTSLGSNVAWFTFEYEGKSYKTPEAATPIGSGDGSGTPGTATLVKTNKGYDPAGRTILWEVTINPHKANLRNGTFTDDLRSLGPLSLCSRENEHGHGLEVVDGPAGIALQIDGTELTETDRDKVEVSYENQQITVTIKDIGPRTITLHYVTKVCDPCVFANNTSKAAFKNVISTQDMVLGSSGQTRSAEADSTALVSTAVLEKKKPVYDYETGIMRWTVEVNQAGLTMKDVVLTDDLPAGLTFVADSLTTNPVIAGASAKVQGQELTIELDSVTAKTMVTFDTRVDPEMLQFGGDKPVVVENTIHMNGTADGVEFAQVSHQVRQSFSNHGLVKSSAVDNSEEFIQYEVLVNPYHLALPEKPLLVDTLDRRLQLDIDTLLFYKAKVAGTTENKDQKPAYTKEGPGQSLKVTDFDPDTNCFTLQLPIDTGSRDAYVVTYRADMIQRETGGYGNSVRFDGGSVLLGGGKNNSASVGGGGGGGGGGVAARKAAIVITKIDRETKTPLPGVTFLLYQWGSEGQKRGLPFAQGKTDANGIVSFKVKPKAAYELVETESIPGYGSVFGWTSLPPGVTETDSGLLLTAGEARSELRLELTNEPNTADIVFRLVNQSDIPMAGAKVQMFKEDPSGTENPLPDMEVLASPDGTVRFAGIRRGATYYIRYSGGKMMTVEVPIPIGEEPRVKLGDGTWKTLRADDPVAGVAAPEQQWTLTVKKVMGDGITPLPGVVMGLYADAACVTLIKKEVSDSAGMIRLPGLMKGQRYWMREIQAPSGYHLNSTVYNADENNNAMTIISMEETPSVDPEEPGNPDAPGEPGTPGSPDISGKPGIPENPDTPGKPGIPGGSGASGESDTLRKPGTPERADTFGNTGTLERRGIAGEQHISGKGDLPGEPGNQEGAYHGGVGISAQNPNIPQTGDDIWLWIAVTLISAILLTVMAVYQILRNLFK